MVNKVVYGNEVLIDLTSDSVEESKVLKGTSFHKKDGTIAQGSAVVEVDGETVKIPSGFGIKKG